MYPCPGNKDKSNDAHSKREESGMSKTLPDGEMVDSPRRFRGASSWKRACSIQAPAANTYSPSVVPLIFLLVQNGTKSNQSMRDNFPRVIK